jgi:hypothetical protein
MFTLLFIALVIIGLFVLSGCAVVEPTPAATPQPSILRDGAGGDSIAWGTGQALHVATFARVGEPSCPNRKRPGILSLLPAEHFNRFVMSAGVNDAPGLCVPKIAAWMSGHTARGYWLVGYGAPESAMVVNSAAAYGQRVLFFTPGPDRVHPRSYPEVAGAVRRAWQ